MPSSADRTQPDRCPGVLAVHEAADGGLARVRLPGGVLSARQLEVLSAASVALGDGNLELTSRANIQIRALRPGAPRVLSDRLYAAGLLPSITHERVRNILASPMSGLDKHSLYDVLPAAAELDRLLCERPEFAELPGRFLFALDDGRGDLALVKADVAVRMVAGGQAELVLAGAATGVLVAESELAAVMLAGADAFLAERAAQGSDGWRLAELEDGPARVLERMGMLSRAAAKSLRSAGDAAGLPDGAVSQVPGRWGAAAGLAAGRCEQVDGRVALVATVPLGSLGPGQVGALVESAERGSGERGSGGIRVTPWRSVVLPGLVEADVDAVVERLAAVGLVVEADSPWNGVTACAGRPGCAKALADVRGDARRLTPRMSAQMSAGRRAVHWSGCERRCGKPSGEFVDVVAVSNGYAVNGSVASSDEVGELIGSGVDDDVMGMQ